MLPIKLLNLIVTDRHARHFLATKIVNKLLITNIVLDLFFNHGIRLGKGLFHLFNRRKTTPKKHQTLISLFVDITLIDIDTVKTGLRQNDFLHDKIIENTAAKVFCLCHLGVLQLRHDRLLFNFRLQNNLVTHNSDNPVDRRRPENRNTGKTEKTERDENPEHTFFHSQIALLTFNKAALPA